MLMQEKAVQRGNGRGEESLRASRAGLLGKLLQQENRAKCVPVPLSLWEPETVLQSLKSQNPDLLDRSSECPFLCCNTYFKVINVINDASWNSPVNEAQKTRHTQKLKV